MMRGPLGEVFDTTEITENVTAEIGHFPDHRRRNLAVFPTDFEALDPYIPLING